MEVIDMLVRQCQRKRMIRLRAWGQDQSVKLEASEGSFKPKSISMSAVVKINMIKLLYIIASTLLCHVRS